MSQQRYSSGPSPQIRPLVATDLDAVIDLSLRAWRPVFESFRTVLGETIYRRLYPDGLASQATAVRQVCQDKAMDCFVAVDGDAIAGFVALARLHEPPTGIVEMIAVDPSFQRRGHGRALMQFAVRQFSDAQVPLINVGTGGDPGHAPARHLYEAAGFRGLPLVNYYLAIEPADH